MTDFSSKLDRLFQKYREIFPDPEPSANFMPGLWARIEAERGWVWHLKVYSRRILTAAAVVCLLLLGIEFTSLTRSSVFGGPNYVESLVESEGIEDMAYGQMAVAMGVDFE
jgi:hypothetical protein